MRQLPGTRFSRLSFSVLLILCLPLGALSQSSQRLEGAFTVARVKYHGGGDWYNDPSVIPNLLRFMQETSNVLVGGDQKIVELTDEELFSCPVLYLTGHGNIVFSDEEVQRLRTYLIGGGFLYADDDYGMDKAFRREIKKVFPNRQLLELPLSFPIYEAHFSFPNGLPKIHEHDGKPPQGFGIFYEGRLVVYYTYETNISDGWADPDVHNDPPENRRKALEMGTNIMVYALLH